MAPATACVAPSAVRTPPVQQQLQQRHLQQRQAPVSQQHQGQQRSQQYYGQHQHHEHQDLSQLHLLQQRQEQHQQHFQLQLPQQQRYSQHQQHLHLDQLRTLQQQQVHQQPQQVSDEHDATFSFPYSVSLPPHQSGPTPVAAPSAHLSHNAPWCSVHLNQEESDCLSDSAVLTAMRQQVNSAPSSDKRPIPAGFPPLYLSRSREQFLPATARSETPAGVLSARKNSGSDLSPSSLCTLASSGSGVSDTSTSPGDGNTFVSSLATPLDSSQDSAVQFAGQASAATSDLEESPSSTLSKTATSAELLRQQTMRSQQQQLRDQPPQRQQPQCQPPSQLSHRQPAASIAQQQQRLPRQQRGIVSGGAEPALTVRQLRYTAAATPPTPAATRFKYGSRNSIGTQQASTRPPGNRRLRHQVRQHQDQRTQLERQRQSQLPRQQTHCRCTSAGVQQRPQRVDTADAALRASISSYPTVHLTPTGDAGAVAISSAVLPRAACDDLSLSIDEWNTSRHANTDAALLHHVQGLHHASGSTRSTSSLAFMRGVGCETPANAAAGSRGLGLPPLPYLYYDLRIGGGARWPATSFTCSRQAPGNNGNTILRLSCVTSSESFEDRATRGKDSLTPSAGDPNAVYPPTPLNDVAAAAAVRGYPSSPTDVAAASSPSSLITKKASFDRTAAVAAQKAAKSAADAATAAAAVAAATAAAAGVNGRSAVHRLQRRLAQSALMQSRSGELPPQNLHLVPGMATVQTVPNPAANCRSSAIPSKPQLPANRPKVTSTRSEHWEEQQPTVTLPLLCGSALSKATATPTLHTGDFQISCSSVMTNARPTLLFEDAPPHAETRRLGKSSTAGLPCAIDNSVQVTACTPHAGVVAPAPGGTSSPTSGKFSSAGEPACAGGTPDLKTPQMSVCAPLVEACACRSSDHIGRGRGPGGSDVAPCSQGHAGVAGGAAATTNDNGAASAEQRPHGLERTWLRLLCESEAVAEGKVRTCRSSAPIPPAVLLRAPEKLEGHVISSSSGDILRPPFYSLLQKEGVCEGGIAVGTDGTATTGWLKNHKSAGGTRTGAEQSGTKQRQVSGSSDTARKVGGPGSGGAAVAIVETLHLEKLLQSAIYGAVFRANLHTVFRTTRASKKPRQGDEDGQDIDSRCSSGITSSSVYANEEGRNGAHVDFSCGGRTTAASAAAAEGIESEGVCNKEELECAEDNFALLRGTHPQQTQNEGFFEETYCENFQGEAIGTIELRSQVVAVKVLSLSLQLNASPSLQEDFLSELKFYPYLKGHRNILVPHRIYVDRAQQLLLLVFPFAEFEDLFEVLKKRKKPFAEAEVQWICKQLLQAVLFLHRRGIAMRDLSLENVLMCRCPETGFAVPKLTDPGQAVIADQEAATATRAAAIVKRYNTVGGNCGCRGQQVKGDRETDAPRGRQRCGAACQEGTETITCGTLQESDTYDPPAVFLAPDKIFGKSFRPPEVYQQCSYNPFKVDSFCMGWMTYYLLTKQQLFQRAAPSDDNWRLLSTKNASDLLLLLGRKNGAVLSVEGLDFVVRLLEDDPERRMTIYQALSHPFIALSKPCPVLADKLFPDDAAAQEQHTAKQRQFHVRLLQQKQSLLQLYNMRWRDQTGLRTTIVPREVPQKQESKVQPEQEKSPQSNEAHATCEQTHREVAVFSVQRRTSPCQRKRTQNHQRQSTHQQRQEFREEMWQNHPQRAPPRLRGDSAAPDSSPGCHLPQEHLEQSVTPKQQARGYSGRCTADHEPHVATVDDTYAAAYEGLTNERPAPTLLVQHSTLLRGSPPAASTPCQCWSAGIPPILQKVPPLCESSRQNLLVFEKQDVDLTPHTSWEVESDGGAQDLDGVTQDSGERTSERKDRQLQFTMQKKLQLTTVGPDTNEQQPRNMNCSDLVKQSRPLVQQPGEFAANLGYASSQQHSQRRLTAGLTSESSHFQRSAAKKEVAGEAIRNDVDVCPAEPVLLAAATVQLPVSPLAGFVRAVEREGTAHLQSKHPFLENNSSGQQNMGEKRRAQALPYPVSTQKQPGSGRAGVRQVSTQEENETTTARLGGLSDTEEDSIERVSPYTDGGAVVRDAFSAAELNHLVMEDNRQEITGTECTSARSELPVQLSSLNNKDTQTNMLSQSKVDRIDCVVSSVQPSTCKSTDSRPKAVPEEKLAPFPLTGRAAAGRGCKNELSCEVEDRGAGRNESGQRQRQGGVSVKTVNSCFGKGRRGPSSSSTETGSTAGENCGGRSDSDYCVGLRNNGATGHYSRMRVSCEALQRCVVRPPVAVSPGTGGVGRSKGVHETAASAEGL